jgi:hypothetical protein
MSTITFQKALSLRKWIRANSNLINADAARYSLILSKEELLKISKACQDAIIPGMPSSEVRAKIRKTTDQQIEMIIPARLASSNPSDKENPQLSQAVPS